MISFNYSNKPIKLKPGILSNFFVKSQNYFIVEITQEMSDLLILRSFQDSQLQMCAFFNGLDNFSNVTDQCQFDSQVSISLYFKNQQIKEGCEKFAQDSCYLIIKISGQLDHKFSLGYVYNDKPFKIFKENIVYGPHITKGNYKINFIQHLDKEGDELLTFNSKGLDLNIYTQLIDGDSLGNELLLPFPSSNKHDEKARKEQGNLTTIFYSQKQIQEFGNNPELLISVRPNPSSDSSEVIYDGNFTFSLHSGMGSIALPINSQLPFDLPAEEFQYFNFYNNGRNNFFSIQITSDSNAFFTVYLAKDLDSRPPLDPYIKKQSGFGQVLMLVEKKDFVGKFESQESPMKGHFSLGIKSNG